MNTLLVPSPASQTKPLRKPSLPSPPEHESPLDRAIRLAGVTPLCREDVVRRKRRVLIAEKTQRGIPLWWSGEVQDGIVVGMPFGLLFAGACLLWGLIWGVLSIVAFGVTAAVALCIVEPGFAFGVMLFTCLVMDRISLDTPYWRSWSLERYQKSHYLQPVPLPIQEMIDEIKMRLPKARFQVLSLEYASDPILLVQLRGRGLSYFRRETRYLAIWGE